MGGLLLSKMITESGDHLVAPADRSDHAGMIVVTLGRLQGTVAEDRGRDPETIRQIRGNACGRAVAEPVRTDRVSSLNWSLVFVVRLDWQRKI